MFRANDRNGDGENINTNNNKLLDYVFSVDQKVANPLLTKKLPTAIDVICDVNTVWK